MARPKAPARGRSRVSGNSLDALTAAAATYASSRPMVRRPIDTDRREIAKRWQIEAYRHVNICGEARYAATLYANIAGRAEIGVSEPQALGRKAVWVNEGEEVAAFAELVPTVRDRSQLIRDYMTHRQIAGECYLIARDRLATDVPDQNGFTAGGDPVWEIVAVTELRKTGKGEDAIWSVRHENDNWIELATGDPVIRLWCPDPENRMEAWSPFRSLLPTLREIEWFTKHIFTQVQSRLMSAGVWFLPDNLTFAPPPPDAIEGDYDQAMASMNDAEKFMVSLAASSMDLLDGGEVSFPSIVMADPVALANVDQNKLIQFWSEIDDKAMTLRSDAVRRFALGIDMPPEQVLGSSGLAVTGAGGSAGSVNHWGVWANEEQTISAHIEPALDDLTMVLTTAFLRNAVEGTDKVIGYDTTALRLRQDRSKEAIELYDRGLLNPKITVREVGFDPASDMMDDKEFKRWLLVKLAGGSATPEQVQAAFALLGVVLPVAPPVEETKELMAPGHSGRNEAPSLDDHPYEGPPRVQHDQTEAPFAALVASAEGLVLRALEKAGNRLLNDDKRGREKTRTIPAHTAHLSMALGAVLPATSSFDFGLVETVFSDKTPEHRQMIEARLRNYCHRLYQTATPYSREGLAAQLEGL